MANETSERVISSTLSQLHQLRDIAYVVLSAIANEREPLPKALNELEQLIKEAIGRSPLTIDSHHFCWSAPICQPEFVVDSFVLSIDDFP